MAEEWRAVARRVPAILAPIRAMDEAPMDLRLPNLLHRASNAIRLRGGELASIRHGVPEVVEPLHQPALPCTLLARANAVLRQHHKLHCEGARFLALYGERLGFLQPAPAIQRDPVFLQPAPAILRDQMANANAWWECWLRNRLDAIDSKREVSRKLRLAAAYDAAMFDAARRLPVLGRVDAGGRVPRRARRGPDLLGVAPRAQDDPRRRHGVLQRHVDPGPHLSIRTYPIMVGHGCCVVELFVGDF